MNSDAFCKLGSDLVISYNGSFLECLPTDRSSIVGTVLTRNGKLISRRSRRCDWELLSTPSVYLFYDNDSNTTFLVDTCKNLIKKIQPEGRILDCTDRIIYEIKCNDWVPVCDLSNQINRVIVLCNTVPAGSTTATFTFPGKNPIVEPFSEISANQVVFCGHTATVTFSSTLPGCIILAFTVCIDNETVTIFKIFIRQNTGTRFSAQGGQIAPTPINTPLTVTTTLPATPNPVDNLIVPTGGFGGSAKAFATINWTTLYDKPVPGSFNPTTGVYTVLTTNDYLIGAQLSYNSPTPISNLGVAFIRNPPVVTAVTFRHAVPYFALLRNAVIIAIAPVTANLLPVSFANLGIQPPPYNTPTDVANALSILGVTVPTGGDPTTTLNFIAGAISTTESEGVDFYDLEEIGEADFNIGLTLNANDTLQIVYVDPLNIFTGNPASAVALPVAYQLIPAGTTFNTTQLL